MHRLPPTRPATPLLDAIDSPTALRKLPEAKLPALAEQLRYYLLYSVGQSGGHFGAGLGVVELTIALHYLLDTPNDTLIWDVGHQSYPHKVLTGRREQLPLIRHQGGPAPFPHRAESPYDAFGTGHSSTSISAALGFALAHQLKGEPHLAVAVIGDGAMTAGMAYEALNHASHTQANLLVVLNDNGMSISHNEGGLATRLAKLTASAPDGSHDSGLFSSMNIQYSGPIDGHNLPVLIDALRAQLSKPGPKLLHVITQKGRGYLPAEEDPVGFHAVHKISAQGTPPAKKPTFANVFGHWLVNTAEQHSELVAITPAMREGSDLVAFSQQFPQRYFDVAIAEQHAVTLAGGLACGGAKPVVAIYSTFLQRGYDQLVHDLVVQQLDITLAIDRAGLVGEDGDTHTGLYDIAFTRTLPDLILITPSDEQELYCALNSAYHTLGVVAVRYPRGAGTLGGFTPTQTQMPIGRGVLKREGERVALLNFGPLLNIAAEVAEAQNYTLVDMRFVKPLDGELITKLCATHQLLATLEDHALAGGAGSAVLEWLEQAGITMPVLRFGVPDRWLGHASRSQQLIDSGLTAEQITARIHQML